MPGKSTLAPLAGLAMALIAAACLVTFSMVASNTVGEQSSGIRAARPQAPPGGGDGAVTVQLPDGGIPAPGSGGSTPETGSATSPPTGGSPEAAGSGDSIGSAALADFFGGTPSEGTLVARVSTVTGRPQDRLSTIREPAAEPQPSNTPSKPAGSGDDDCPPGQAKKYEENPDAETTCGKHHGAPARGGHKGTGHDGEDPDGGAGPPDSNPSGGSGKPPKKEKSGPPPTAAPPGKSGGSGRPEHPHGEPPGHSGGGSSGSSGNPHGEPPGKAKSSGGHPHGGPPGQNKK